MRRLLSELEEGTYRKLLWVAWVVFPVDILFLYALVVLDIGWYRFIFIIPCFACCSGSFFYYKNFRVYIHRITGVDRTHFMVNYYQLWACSVVCKYANQYDALINMVVFIKRMAGIMEVEFSLAKDFAFQNAGTLLNVPNGLPMRLPDVPDYMIVLKVLDSTIEELPMYITHTNELVRKTASYRITHENTT